jgi:hypothetical protein
MPGTTCEAGQQVQQLTEVLLAHQVQQEQQVQQDRSYNSYSNTSGTPGTAGVVATRGRSYIRHSKGKQHSRYNSYPSSDAMMPSSF